MFPDEFGTRRSHGFRTLSDYDTTINTGGLNCAYLEIHSRRRSPMALNKAIQRHRASVFSVSKYGPLPKDETDDEAKRSVRDQDVSGHKEILKN